MTVGAQSKAKLSFVVGKSEEWWLFLTIPYYAPRIQWGWAFSSIREWYWPYAAYGASLLVMVLLLSFKYPTSHKHSFYAVIAALLCCLFVDFLFPVMLVFRRLDDHWPTSGLWNWFVFYKLLLYAEFIYLFLSVENGWGFKTMNKWKWKVASLVNIEEPADGPVESRNWFAPVSIIPKSYFIDLCIWVIQVFTLCVAFAIHIGLCLYFLFVVLLYRLYDFNREKMDEYRERAITQINKGTFKSTFKSMYEDDEYDTTGGITGGKKDSSKSVIWLIALAVQARIYWLLTYSTGFVAGISLRFPFVRYVLRIPSGLVLIVLSFFMFPMYFACSVQETLPARTLRLLPGVVSPRAPIARKGVVVRTRGTNELKYVSLKFV